MVIDDFPFWLRFAHFINLIFIVLLIRSGIEILSAFPKLYWNDHARPGTEWIKFTKKKFLPSFEKRVWISLEEEKSFPSWISLPGHKNLGMGRHWHFFSILFWIGNGVAYYILLFTSDQWQRLIPTSWSIFPDAFHDLTLYASFQFNLYGNPYDSIQQLTYFSIVFLLGPFMIATGAAMSPAIGARFPQYPKIFGGRQVARSLHFLGMVGFVLFIIIHIAMVMLSDFSQNMGNIFLGHATSLGIAIGIFALFVLIVLAVNIWATAISLRNPRFVQVKLGALIEYFRRILFRKAVSRQQFSKSEVTPFFRVNGYPPETDEYKKLLENKFVDWNLDVNGLIENPIKLSLVDLHKLKKETQITEHSCIQGWTAIGEWGGLSMDYIISVCKPLSQAKYIVFHSYQYTNGYQFYEAIPMELAKHPQTILAYEMNGNPLDVPHGAPLRLRVETQLGYKMVKWIKSIEFVSDYKHIGMGHGGHREDHMYYDLGAGI
ncbi:MAG: molybdopterin-dependent oxidoreductase [Candidatus Nitrosocosmicus sp.]|jgi:thiosulfate reductase cytochrome b subunit|uniref:molybdopterin-dependent oxidoreductase n=1 Tax=Candidatus Nitrosocosmicus agrestis TaxID=2563600 RepID=UPI00122E8FED|nr:molybdopterin-dependent oxidoreductase [Candidatus Nitrosocosmicus sp. SS]KAA2281602.1 molybdopterin-dependent oxidoreductase [Candidatus Nitrosocosmicus sp. SS]KAF0869804.1 oxidoreductase [Candidatus Nitrosocosmicus sp. SS]MDR4490405.1 molybdopterin-dependent oxidoreductase [Candidatus Nitrosocosmicus sp.]